MDGLAHQSKRHLQSVAGAYRTLFNQPVSIEMFDFFSIQIENWINIVLLIAALAAVATLATFFFVDLRQQRHAIRRNYPLIGRLRYKFEKLGEFMRPYLFAMDREEMPFNRAERSWVYRAAKGVDTTLPFGSTRSLSQPRTILFVNHPFPAMRAEFRDTSSLVIGAGCRNPFTAHSIFNISGMSYGALSKPAVQALAHGAKMARCWLNTGEGGLSPYHLEGGCDLIFQIGTAKFGVRDENGQLSDDKLRTLAAHENIRAFEIKLSQGAKPGKGGILPGGKVTEEIAKIRGIRPGEDSFSPNGHADIRSYEQLLDFIAHVRDITGKPTGFKIAIGSKDTVVDLCEAILRRGMEAAPDFITVDGAEGGSGAAPQALLDYMGLPLNEILPITVDTLTEMGLAERVKVIASGKLITPEYVAWALCVGAHFVVSARGFMFALGCVQSLKCNQNTCPTGITTHQPGLQRGLAVADKKQRVAHYALRINAEVATIAHSCGVNEPRELQRHHARIINSDGISSSLEELHAPKAQEISKLTSGKDTARG